jgi:hypothetical protein
MQIRIESGLRTAGREAKVRFLGGPTPVSERNGNPAPPTGTDATNYCGSNCQVAYYGCNSCGEHNCKVMCYCDSGDWQYCDHDCC